ncbi:MAG: hypothetical protein WBF81_04445 [Thermoplasmata archaeon]
MTSVFGWPLAVVLLVAGVLVFAASWVIHWVLLVLAVVLVAVGFYLLLTGAAIPV